MYEIRNGEGVLIARFRYKYAGDEFAWWCRSYSNLGNESRTILAYAPTCHRF